jgi:hypothetical protein
MALNEAGHVSVTSAGSPDARSRGIRGKTIIAMFVALAGVCSIAWLGLIGWFGLALLGY